MTNKEKIEAILQKNIVDKTGVLNSITPGIMADTVQEITDYIVDMIDTNITLSHFQTEEKVSPGTSLIPGKWYYMYNFTEGDDFTNVGSQNQNYTHFKANDSTPTKWTTTYLNLVTNDVELLFNNTGAILTFDFDFITSKLTIRSNIDLFYLNKISVRDRMLPEDYIVSPTELAFYPNIVMKLSIYK